MINSVTLFRISLRVDDFTLKQKMQKTILIFTLLIASLFLSIAVSMASTNVAYAAVGGCTGNSGGSMGGNTGSSQAGGDCNTDPDPDAAAAEADRTVDNTSTATNDEPAFDPNSFPFRVGCALYLGPAGGGAGGYGVPDYQLSSMCVIPRASISAKAYELGGGDPAWRDGKITYNGAVLGNSSTVAWDACNAQGENSAYAKDYIRTVTGVQTIKVTVTLYASGRFTTVRERIATTYTSDYTSLGCAYPAPVIGAAKDCFYNYNGNSHYSQDRGAIRSNGELVKVRGALAGDPRAPIWNGDPATEPQCDRTGSANVKITQNLEENGYGYYRLHPTYSYQQYQRTDWVGGDVTFYSKWTNPNGGNGSNTNWFTYSCSADKPFEGPFSYGNLPNRNANFDPASCPQVNWQCELADSTTIGLDRGIIPAGQTKVTIPVTVMRNGESIPLTFSKLRVVDYTTGGAGVNVTDGVAGSGVRNVTSIDYKSNVKEGSTPFYGTDVNSNNQYFKQYQALNNRNIEKWDIWLSNANTNVAKGIAFNWASEGDASFVAERQYRITAEFHVPRGTTIDSDGNAGSYSYQWIRDTKNCYEYDANNNQTNNMLTATSNPTNVVRSVGEGN
jgi:hypothetical protein